MVYRVDYDPETGGIVGIAEINQDVFEPNSNLEVEQAEISKEFYYKLYNAFKDDISQLRPEFEKYKVEKVLDRAVVKRKDTDEVDEECKSIIRKKGEA